MINSVSGTSSSSYLWQLLQASKSSGTSTGTSTDSVFSSLDNNGDGSISKNELSAALGGSSSASSILGSDSDSTSSFVNLLEALTKAIASTTGSSGSHSTGRLSPEEMFQKSDANGDSSLSKTEFENGRPSDMTAVQADELYSKLDKDNDGSISQSEFTAKGPRGPNGPPPPPPDSTDSTSESASTSNLSPDLLSAASFFMQAIFKYVAQSSAATTASSSLSMAA